MEIYRGLIRIVGIKIPKAKFKVGENDLHLNLDVIVPHSNIEGSTYTDLDFSIKEFGDVPALGEYFTGIIKDGRIVLIDI